MDRLRRDAPLPGKMQGRWVGADDQSAELVVDGGDITCFGQAVAYDYKDVGEEDGALVVSLGIDDAAGEDTFQRTNIVGLVIAPDGSFHVWNAKFTAHFVRPVPL